MDLQELEARTRFNRRKLRYVLDHNLVPGLEIEIAADRAGRPRKFHEDVGIAIVCAATLLEQGLAHETVRAFLRGLTQVTIPANQSTKLALVVFLEQRGRGKARLGDGINCRITSTDHGWDTGWVAPGNPAALSAAYEPLVEIVLDLGRVRESVMD